MIDLPQVALGPLSLESALNVIAAEKLFNKGVAEKIIFTTGKTTGRIIPSEAEAMKNLLQEIWPEIPDRSIVLEEKSKDTSGNAEEVSKIIRSNNFKNIGIVDVGFHLKNARTLFERYGVRIADKNSFVAEEVVAADAIYTDLFPNNYKTLPLSEKKREKNFLEAFFFTPLTPKENS